MLNAALHSFPDQTGGLLKALARVTNKYTVLYRNVNFNLRHYIVGHIREKDMLNTALHSFPDHIGGLLKALANMTNKYVSLLSLI